MFKMIHDVTIVAMKLTQQLNRLKLKTKIADKPLIKQCMNMQGNTPFDISLIVAKA